MKVHKKVKKATWKVAPTKRCKMRFKKKYPVPIYFLTEAQGK
jgi:hypothetical protein